MKNSFTSSTNIIAADLHASKVIYAVKISLFTIIAILIIVLKGSTGDSTNLSAKNSLTVQLPGVGNIR